LKVSLKTPTPPPVYKKAITSLVFTQHQDKVNDLNKIILATPANSQ
jgi:hypothetical protein